MLRACDLSPIAPPHPLGGAVNGTVLARTADRDIVLRVHRPWTTPDRLAYVHEVLDLLREGGVPVPAVLRTRDGASFARVADRLVEVIGYVESDGPANTWDRNRAAFGMLARLHGALASAPEAAAIPPAVSSYATPEDGLAMLRETEARWEEGGGHPSYDAASAARRSAADLFRALSGAWAGYAPGLPRQLVHGDYGWDNVLMRGGQVACVLDFDFLGYRERVWDVAYALYWVLDRLGGHKPENMRRAGPLLAAYDAAASTPLTGAERRALPFEMARVPLYWIAEAGYTEDPVGQTLAYARHLRTSRVLLENAAEIGVTLGEGIG